MLPYLFIFNIWEMLYRNLFCGVGGVGLAYTLKFGFDSLLDFILQLLKAFVSIVVCRVYPAPEDCHVTCNKIALKYCLNKIITLIRYLDTKLLTNEPIFFAVIHADFRAMAYWVKFCVLKSVSIAE